MLLGRSRWATKRTSGLSIPIPNAMVATMMTPSSRTNASWWRLRSSRVHARVVGEGVVSPDPEPSRSLLHLASRQAVDDARVVAVLGFEEAQELLACIVLRHDGVADVRAIEAADEDASIAEPEALGDLAPGRRVGGGGEGDSRHVRIAFVQHRELEVLGPEVVAPLRHAVRFVDGEEGDADPVEQRQGAIAHQAFGRDVEEIERARAGVGLDRPDFVEVKRRVQVRGLHAGLAQRLHLVLHQCDQRRHDDRDTVAEKGRNLVAERLAAAGGHDHEAVAAARDMLDDRFLPVSERAVSEDALEHFVRCFGARRRIASRRSRNQTVRIPTSV